MRTTNVMTTREAALRLGISIRRLMSLLAEGKLPGAYKIGLIWQIPVSAVETRTREMAKFYSRRAPTSRPDSPPQNAHRRVRLSDKQPTLRTDESSAKV